MAQGCFYWRNHRDRHVVRFLVHVSLTSKLLHSPGSYVGRLGVLCIGTCYGLDGPGLEFGRGGEIFCTHPDRSWGQTSLLYNGYRVFIGSKAAGAWRWPPTPSSAEVKERVELYTYSSFGLSWPDIGRKFSFTLTIYLYRPTHPRSELRKIWFYVLVNSKFNRKSQKVIDGK